MVLDYESSHASKIKTVKKENVGYEKRGGIGGGIFNDLHFLSSQ